MSDSKLDEKDLDQFTQFSVNTDSELVIPEQECRECNQHFPLTREFWHVDQHAPRGFRETCKACRKVVEGAQAAKESLAQAQELDVQLVENIRLSLAYDGRQEAVPHATALLEEIFRCFGGKRGYAQQLAATFAAAKPGSAIREKILRAIMGMTQKVSDAGHAEEDLTQLTDDELKVRHIKAVEMAVELQRLKHEQEIDARNDES